MKQALDAVSRKIDALLAKLGFGMRTKLIIIFLLVKVIPLILLSIMAWQQIANLGSTLRGIAVEDSTAALNENATENIERLTTDTALRVADFLYARDADILYLAALTPSNESYRDFAANKKGRLLKQGEWELSADGSSWSSLSPPPMRNSAEGISTNEENNENDAFRYRVPENFTYAFVPLYDEIAFIDLDGNQLFKYVSEDSTKVHYPMNAELTNVAERENTYVKAETYFEKLKELKPGDIYVSDVTGAYVGSNYIGMYAPEVVAKAAADRGYDIPFLPEEQAFSGRENPVGQRFEGIVRWATPVIGKSGEITGYVTFALNHDHIMEFVDHQTPMKERYSELSSAFEGNYAFIWDYKCRSICHPRHHSIYGFDPETGNPQVPWLESSIYDAWQESGVESWSDFVEDWPEFDQQSRSKKPAPALTQAGLVGLDGRYLNNAPQCTGWMDLTEDGGSGSFYILWSGLKKLTTAAAIPYYTGQYAPSEENGFSKRGFGIVTIGAGLEDFTQPARATEEKLEAAISKNLIYTVVQLMVTTVILIILIVFVAIWMASFLTNTIQILINGVSRFRAGERQFRFRSTAKDEFGTLADSFDDMADSVVDSVNSPLCITDLDQKVIYMNEPGLAICRKTLDEIVGTHYGEVSVYPPNSKYCPITALLEGYEPEAVYVEENKTYVKGAANYLLDKDGNKSGYIVVSTDVTEIMSAIERAEQASRAKSEFLSNMSHEIRTPMNAIIGMTSIGKSTADIERKDYSLQKIEDASTHLLGVINDILDMSKIEANKLDLSPTEFYFEKMLQKVVDVIIFRVDEKQQRMDVRIDPGIPRAIIGDDQRIAQVITNLLSNAVKFTSDGGSIILDARLLSNDNGLCSLQISVTDTGIGITPEQQSRLFRSFQQAESSTSRKFGGTGLGLAISKRIVELMGGNIWVTSEAGKGSTFTFTIQVRMGENHPRSVFSANVNKQNMRILAVDDAPEMLDFFEEMSSHHEIACDTASSGEEALALIEKNGLYDMYFVDWKMPGMNGIELSRRIKEFGQKQSVVVMISAAVWSTIEDEAKAAGVDCFLPKPLFPAALIDCIEEHLGGQEHSAEDVIAEEDINLAGYRVLLAEDVEINREIVLTLLEPTELEIDCAENGVEAVHKFTEAHDKYDMIFMDVQMPEMDGMEATRRIRALDLPEAQTIPIIAMTANVFREDIENCLAAGMNAHIGKPLDLDDVLDMLSKYLPPRS